MSDQSQSSTTTIGLRPVHDWAVIKILDEHLAGGGRGRTAAGLYLPDTADTERLQIGKVIATGPGRWRDKVAQRVPMAVKVGDTVLFNRRAGIRFKWGGEEYVAVREQTADEQTIVGVLPE